MEERVADVWVLMNTSYNFRDSHLIHANCSGMSNADFSFFNYLEKEPESL